MLADGSFWLGLFLPFVWPVFAAVSGLVVFSLGLGIVRRFSG